MPSEPYGVGAITASLSTPCEYEATLDDLCFGWAVETNLVYAARSVRHIKKGTRIVWPSPQSAQ
jgi:hypothetical protein